MMVDWKRISKAFFTLGILGFLMTVFYAFIQMTAMYAPPDVMAQHTARKGQEIVLFIAGVAILLVAGVASHFLARKQDGQDPPRKDG